MILLKVGPLPLGPLFLPQIHQWQALLSRTTPTLFSQPQASDVCFWSRSFFSSALVKDKEYQVQAMKRAKDKFLTPLNSSKNQGFFTWKSGSGSFNRRSPKMSSQYLAILYCWCLLQWFSNDKINGYSEVTKAQSLMA